MKCWQCGVAPTEIADVTTLGATEPAYLPKRWPPGDHEHAIVPPTPGQLLEAGSHAYDRVIDAWTD